MPLTNRDDVRDSLMDSVFARGDLSKAMPKYQFPDRESFPADVFEVIQDELLLDGNARQNLATFCQTWAEPEIHNIMDLAIQIESRCVHMLADLWNSPDSANTLGTSAVGSSEACMLGGMAMKWRWRARMAAQQMPADRPNLVRPGADLLAQVLPLLGRGDAPDPDGARTFSDERRGSDQARR